MFGHTGHHVNELTVKPNEAKTGQTIVTDIPCPDCGHTAHAGRCFNTVQVGKHYLQCECKARFKP